MSKILFLDLETTGLNPRKHGVIQLGGIVEIDGKIEDEFSFSVKPFPGDAVDQEALNVNKITAEEIEKFSKPFDVYQQFIEILGRYVDKFNKKDKFFLVGYNVRFDAEFLRSWFKKASDNYFGSRFFTPYLDVMSMAGLALMSERPGMKDFKLSSVGPHFAKIDESQLHDATYDIRVTREIFTLLRKKWSV